MGKHFFGFVSVLDTAVLALTEVVLQQVKEMEIPREVC